MSKAISLKRLIVLLSMLYGVISRNKHQLIKDPMNSYDALSEECEILTLNQL